MLPQEKTELLHLPIRWTAQETGRGKDKNTETWVGIIPVRGMVTHIGACCTPISLQPSKAT